MNLFIVGLLVALGVGMGCGVLFLEREIRRHYVRIRDLCAALDTRLNGQTTSMTCIRRDLDSLRKDLDEAEQQRQKQAETTAETLTHLLNSVSGVWNSIGWVKQRLDGLLEGQKQTTAALNKLTFAGEQLAGSTKDLQDQTRALAGGLPGMAESLKAIQEQLAEDLGGLPEWLGDLGDDLSELVSSARAQEDVILEMAADLETAREQLGGLEDTQTDMASQIRAWETVIPGMAGVQESFLDQLIGVRKGLEDLSMTSFSRESSTVKSLKGLWEESQKQTGALSSLLARGDTAEAVDRIAALLDGAPQVLTRDEEARLSKEMEEGVMNLMNYTTKRVPGGAEVGLG